MKERMNENGGYVRPVNLDRSTLYDQEVGFDEIAFTVHHRFFRDEP